MARRTTLLLDEATREAARDLARLYRCSVSEAIRRSVIHQRDREAGVSASRRAERMKALRDAFRVFARNDPAKEIRALKAQDAGF